MECLITFLSCFFAHPDCYQLFTYMPIIVAFYMVTHQFVFATRHSTFAVRLVRASYRIFSLGRGEVGKPRCMQWVHVRIGAPTRL